MTQLYVDLDGVLADFDAGYERLTGVRPDKAKDDVDWGLVRTAKTFYLDLPPMSDYAALWARISRYDPIVLTGVPTSIPAVGIQKVNWVNTWIGKRTMVILCKSKDKANYCRPGDVLIDDWEKHRDRWIAAGGRWITHTSAIETDRALTEIGL